MFYIVKFFSFFIPTCHVSMLAGWVFVILVSFDQVLLQFLGSFSHLTDLLPKFYKRSIIEILSHFDPFLSMPVSKMVQFLRTPK